MPGHAADSAMLRLEFAKIRMALTEIQKSLEILEKQIGGEEEINPEATLPPRRLSLGELFILDRLFRSRFLNPERTTLGDLLILEKLFNP